MTFPAPAGGEVLVHPDAESLAADAAARLAGVLATAQAERGSATAVLTGGTIGTATLAAVADGAGRDAVDWRRVDLWWGDERFLPWGHPDRNETQARAALLDRVPLNPARLHPMPASDGPDGDDPEAAAARYAALLRDAAGGASALPPVDVLLLGVGPDGHVASLFPEHPGVHDPRAVIAVRGAPKPPPTRISLGLSAINAAEEVWLLASGAEKAPAVALANSGAGPVQVPAAGVRGRTRTLWLLDRAAAGHLPR